MSEIPQDAAAMLTAATLAGNAPDECLLEIRCLDRHRAEPGPRKWFPVRDYRAAARFALNQAQRGDVYLSALPRTRPSGTKADVLASWVLWADIDREDGIERVVAFAPRASIVVETGTPGHALGIWQLADPLRADEVWVMNRRLAYALSGDLAATDAARVLRLPGTRNHKHDAPRPVHCVQIEPYSYTVAQVVVDLADPPEPPRAPRRGTIAAGAGRVDVLMEIAPTVYVSLLTGREVGHDGKVRCPFHADGQERTPSLHVWEDPEHGWFCFGCERGGTIIDFGAELYGIAPHGREFHEIRRRLAADLLMSEVA